MRRFALVDGIAALFLALLAGIYYAADALLLLVIGLGGGDRTGPHHRDAAGFRHHLRLLVKHRDETKRDTIV